MPPDDIGRISAARLMHRSSVVGCASNRRNAMEERFQRGELVTLRQYRTAAEPLGRILSVTPAGDRAEVSWQSESGGDRPVTEEPTVNLRRVHESEMSPGTR